MKMYLFFEDRSGWVSLGVGFVIGSFFGEWGELGLWIIEGK